MSTDYPKTPEKDNIMPELTDLSGANPYKAFREAKKQTSIRLKASTLFYFQQMAQQTGIPYQTLINLYLDDCAENHRTISVSWK